GCVAQFPILFQVPNERAKGTISAQEELIIKQTATVDLRLLIGIIVRHPLKLRVLCKFLSFAIRKKTSSILRVRKIRMMRSYHMNPQKKSVGQSDEHLLRLFETCIRAEPHREIAGQMAQGIPPAFEIDVFGNSAP